MGFLGAFGSLIKAGFLLVCGHLDSTLPRPIIVPKDFMRDLENETRF